jgi:hypothetical protein
VFSCCPHAGGETSAREQERELTIKVSPFVLSDQALERLTSAARSEPAVLDLVGTYRRAVGDLTEITEMVHAELDHFGIAQ